MNARRICIHINELAEIDSRFTIGCEAHHFPFVGIRSESEKLREAGIKKSKRIRPIDGLDVIEPPISPMPNRSGFPCAAPVHYHDCRIIEAGVAVRAQRMGEMMIHKAHACLAGAKQAPKGCRSRLLVPHAEEIAR